jgi:D-glycero-alpha-D-manno-heptose-7-phosphate kinase
LGEITRARAPLRLGLAGGGSDVSPYCDQFGGAVLNATIDRFVFASHEPRDDGKVVFRAADLDQVDEVDAAGELPTDQGLKLHRGVYNRMMRLFNGGRPLPMTLTTHVDSPLGSGLGSSSALVVVMVALLAECLKVPMGEYEAARLAHEIERFDLSLNGGRQDHYAAAFGGFNFMEFHAAERVIVNPLRVRRSTMYELESALVLHFTGVSRSSSTIIEDQRESVALGGRALEAMHELKAEAIEMKEALLFGKMTDMARVLERGWRAKKETSPWVSTPQIEEIFDVAMSGGAAAGKVSGAGGGGFIMFLTDPCQRPNVLRRLKEQCAGYSVCTRFNLDGVIVWRPGLV